MPNFFHSIDDDDVADFKKACSKNSHFFSNSEGFINSYLGREISYCYNDGSVIFFLGKISADTIFVCNPKGDNWQGRIAEIPDVIKENFGSALKRVWFWEIPSSVEFAGLRNFRKLSEIKHKRQVSAAGNFLDLNNFFQRSQHLKKRWNHFYNDLCNRPDVVFYSSELNQGNYFDAVEVLNVWKSQKDERPEDGVISLNHVVTKNARMIDDVLRRPLLYETMILYFGARPIGLKIAFKIENSNNLALSVSCLDRKFHRDLIIVLDLLFFNNLAKKSYGWLNWGISHAKSLDDFKKTFLPDCEEHSYEYLTEII